MQQRELDYRDGHEQADVAPVLVDRLPGRRVRVVVRYPHNVRARARTRFFIALGVVIAWGGIGWQAVHQPRIPWWGIFAAGWWPFGPGIILVTMVMWWHANRLYILEAGHSELTLEIQSPLFTRRHVFRGNTIRDIKFERTLRGRPIAITIRTDHRKTTQRLFDGLDVRHLTIIADALREGLGLPPLPASSTPPDAAQM